MNDMFEESLPRIEPGPALSRAWVGYSCWFALRFDLKLVAVVLIGFASVTLSLIGCATGPKADPWAASLKPSTGSLGPIGGYSAGCLDGARSLAPEGPGYEVMRLRRARFYGTTALVNYLQGLGTAIAAAQLAPLRIGDLSYARGGPFTSGHLSHQIGLDVDIWYDHPAEPLLSLEDRESRSAPFIAKSDGTLDDALWDANHVDQVLALAAAPGAVDRIFVNPSIKRRLCALHSQAPWLAKVRPWWGHAEHFHVRLKCPVGALECKSQPAAPPEDGCDGTLDWWFSEEARAQGIIDAGPRKVPELPKACASVLSAPGADTKTISEPKRSTRVSSPSGR